MKRFNATSLARLLAILGLLCGFALILYRTLSLVVFEGQMLNHGRPVEIQEVKGDKTLGQTFVAPLPGLYRIDVLLFDRGRRNTQDVTFHLRPSPDSAEDILSITFNASRICGRDWYTFEFPPLADSAGKMYYFYLSSPTSTDDDAIAVGGIEGDVYRNGTAYLYSTPAMAELAFKTYYSGITLSQKFERLLDRLAENRPFPFSVKHFYIFLVVVYLLLLLALTWRLSWLVLD